MIKKLGLMLGLVLMAGCQHGPGEVADKVLQDFGLQARPEGYVSASDKVFERLGSVGDTEIKRMNAAGRHGEIKYQEKGAGGQYYKEVKVYERAYPLDSRSNSGGPSQGSGPAYTGYIEYSFQYFQSARKATRVEAEAESANVPTGVTGRETYRYNFNSSGIWDGQKGEKARS